MPPPQPLLASQLRGFVCRSCPLRLQTPQRLPCVSRSFASASQAKKKTRATPSKGQQKEQAEPRIRFFNQALDGGREELSNDSVEDFAEALRSTIEKVEQQSGRPFNFSDDSHGIDRRIPSDDPENSELAERITSNIEKLEAKLQILRSNNSTTQSKESTSATVSAAERSRIREAVLKLDDSDIPGPSTAKPRRQRREKENISDPKSTSPINKDAATIPQDEYPRDYSVHISVLNDALQRAAGIISKGPVHPNIHKATWKSYLMCRKALLSVPSKVPLGVWSMLWQIFGAPHELNLDRMAHIRHLGMDMTKAGVSFEASQLLLYIEALFIEGERNDAFTMWAAAKISLGKNEATFKDYWELGVRMFCQDGQVEQALQAAEVLLKDSDDATGSRILVPMIEACLVSNTKSAVQKAWALYVRMRVQMGPNMEMSDYDTVISLFLTANQPDLALGAFKDMMLTGDKAVVREDSTALYKASTGIGDGLGSVKIEDSELNWENSEALAALPRKFNNKYFFGSWIKKLIGDGEFEAAGKVVQLMHDRGICPDAKHMNGLIGAWLRSGTVRNQALAEDMAWKMIGARLEFVKAREVRFEFEFPLKEVRSPGKLGYKTTILTPRATIETFSVLIEHYRRRQKNEILLDLFDTLRKAQIPPNTFFMNQLLLSDSRSHRKDWAWDTYRSLVRRQGVRPDFDTYVCLWHLMKKASDPVLSRGPGKKFATCRYLFAEMVEHASSLTQVEEFPRELYELIILSFSLSDDQVGTAVALRALQQHFNMYPTDNTGRAVVLQLARVGHQNSLGFRPRRLNLNRATKERVAKVTKVLETFKKDRVDYLAQQGIVHDDLEGDAKLEETLALLSDLLRYVTQAKVEEKGSGSVAKLSRIAAEEMGVPDCAPWVT